jgi:hypothetical protein
MAFEVIEEALGERVGEAGGFVRVKQAAEYIPLSDDWPQRRVGVRAKMTANDLSAIDAGEEGGLAGPALRQTCYTERCVERDFRCAW